MIFLPDRPARHVIAALVAVTSATVACDVAGSRPALHKAFPTAEAAAAAVLDGLWQKDTGRLTDAALTEREFHDLVWPRLPASRPEVGMPVEYLWSDTYTKSQGYLARTLAEHGGHRLTLEAVTFEGPTSDYGPFKVHRQTRLVVRDASGTRRELELFGSMIESPDGWKIYSYITD